MAGTGCQAVQILDQILNGSFAVGLAFDGPSRKGHDRYMFLICHFPTEQTLDGVSCRLAQFVGPTRQPGGWAVPMDLSPDGVSKSAHRAGCAWVEPNW